MAKGTLYIVSAPSGAGKSSLINALLKKFNLDDSLRLSISHTTRAPRPMEINHEDYHFVSVEEFEALIARNAFFEYAKVFDNYYGTSKEIVMDWINAGKDVLFDIDWQGAREIKKQVPEAVKIFILPPSLEVLQHRLIKRGQDSSEVISKRMAQAMSEISHYYEYDYVIINDDFDTSLLKLRSIILSKRTELANVKEHDGHILENMQKEAKAYEEAWLPCASALAAALAAAKAEQPEAADATAADATASETATVEVAATAEVAATTESTEDAESSAPVAPAESSDNSATV